MNSAPAWRGCITGKTVPDQESAGSAQDRSGNIIAEADGTTGVAVREYIWLPGAGYAGTDPGSGSGASLPVGVVDAAGSASPELLYVHADHLSRPIRLTDAAKATAWAVEWLPSCRRRAKPKRVGSTPRRAPTRWMRAWLWSHATA